MSDSPQGRGVMQVYRLNADTMASVEFGRARVTLLVSRNGFATEAQMVPDAARALGELLIGAADKAGHV